MQTHLVCLHGFTGTPNAWDRVLELLPAGLVVECPTLLGHGPDDPAPGVASWNAELDRLAARLQAVDAPPRGWHLAGYSLGGRVALGLLARHRELFASATLVGAHPGLHTSEERAARRRADAELARQIETSGLAAFVERWEALPLFASQRRLPAEVQVAQRARRLRHRPAALARALRVLGLAEMPSYRDALPTLDIPVQLVVGAEDTKFRRLAEEMAALLPRAVIEVVPDAGHNVALEAPWCLAEMLAMGLGFRLGNQKPE